MTNKLGSGSKSFFPNEERFKGGTVEPSPHPTRSGRYIPAINIYNGVDQFSRRPITDHVVDPDGNEMSYEDAAAISRKVAAETAHRLGGKTDDVTTHVYDEYFGSTYPDDPRSNYVSEQPRRKAKPHKTKEFEIIYFIIAVVIVAIIFFAVSAMQTKARCEAAPDFVACLMN